MVGGRGEDRSIIRRPIAVVTPVLRFPVESNWNTSSPSFILAAALHAGEATAVVNKLLATRCVCVYI